MGLTIRDGGSRTAEGMQLVYSEQDKRLAIGTTFQIPEDKSGSVLEFKTISNHVIYIRSCRSIPHLVKPPMNR